MGLGDTSRSSSRRRRPSPPRPQWQSDSRSRAPQEYRGAGAPRQRSDSRQLSPRRRMSPPPRRQLSPQRRRSSSRQRPDSPLRRQDSPTPRNSVPYRESARRPASPCRSRSRDRPLTKSHLPEADGTEEAQEPKAEVKEGKPRHNGDPTYQAEIIMSYGGNAWGGGNSRSMAIRGPYRADKAQAEEDADSLQSASKDGVKAVRDCANAMKRSRVH